MGRKLVDALDKLLGGGKKGNKSSTALTSCDFLNVDQSKKAMSAASETAVNNPVHRTVAPSTNLIMGQLQPTWRRFVTPRSEASQTARINPFTIWCKSAYRRKCERLTFYPSFDYKGPDFNTFTGFAIQKDQAVEDKEALQPLLDHIKTIWCKGNELYYEYVDIG